MNRKQRRAEQKLGGPTVQDGPLWGLFSTAVRHHQAGRLAEAEQGYRQVLAVDGRHADSLHLLGVVAYQLGQPEPAVELIRRAIAVNVKDAAYHSNLGLALKALGKLDDAVASFRTAIKLQRDNPEAHNNLGLALHGQGRLDEAIEAYRRAIGWRKDNPEAWNNLGSALQDRGRLDEAVAAYLSAIALRPDDAAAFTNLVLAFHAQGRLAEAARWGQRAVALAPDGPEAFNNLALVRQDQGNLEAAAAACERAIALRPAYAEALTNLGNVRQKQDRFAEAVAGYRQALAIRPDSAETHNNLGFAWAERGRPDQAAGFYRSAIALRPGYVEALLNLAILLDGQGRFDEALACSRRAVAVKPDHPGAHNDLGNALKALGRFDEAIGSYRRAIAGQPDDPAFHANLAMALLAQGDLQAGWGEFEWRWRTPQMATERRGFAQPQWRGEAAEGKILLIHAEQGYGDSIQFCRYAPLAAARGLRVVLEVQTPLVRLLGSLPGVDTVVAQGDALPPFDLQCPMLSLPLALADASAAIPADGPYLRADETLAAVWRTRLAARPGRCVGLVWAGKSRRSSAALVAVDRRRSLAPDRLAPLVDLAGVQFVSLQKEGATPPFPLTDVMAEMNDFADTAALIANLDLVISVDTAVAHLAAALGKPVWLLNRFDSCWRWPRRGEHSPWYPTLRLFSQPSPGDWRSVIERIRTELGRFVAADAG